VIEGMKFRGRLKCRLRSSHHILKA